MLAGCGAFDFRMGVELGATVAGADYYWDVKELAQGFKNLFAEVAEVLDNLLVYWVRRVKHVVDAVL